MRAIVIQPRLWSSDGQENLDAIRRLAERSGESYGPDDVVVLPELVGADLDRRRYVASIRHLARTLGTWIVGGSHHHRRSSRAVNSGVIADPGGDVVSEYDKLNPYGVEAESAIRPGTRVGSFEVNGHRVLVLVCADFWFSRLLCDVPQPPDLVAVPSFSLTQWPSPQPARTLWRHMAIARAYEFSTYVAISDWGPAASYLGQRSSGAAGLADPFPPQDRRLFEPLGRSQLAVHPLDVTRLETLRHDRRARGFLPQSPGRG